MKEWVSKLLEVLFAFGLAFAVVILADRKLCRQKPPQIVVETRVDTLIYHDTLVTYKPKYITKRVIDTMYVPLPVEDGKDTVYAPLPREEKVYADSTYRAVVSGFDARLDSMEVYRKTIYIDREVTNFISQSPGKWSLGIQAGYGVSKEGLSPYIGVGVQYNLWVAKSKKYK